MTQSGFSGLATPHVCPCSVTKIDRLTPSHYIHRMSKANKTSQLELEISRLETSIDALLKIIERLNVENRSLRSQQDTLATERASLIERHDLVRNHVEAIVTRLKSLETGT
jgi:cell division protein ZapB